MRRPLLLVTACLLGVSCRAGVFQIPLDHCPTRTVARPEPEKVVVQYLGVGGFLFKRGDDVILTAPFYSSPSLLEIAFNHELRPDTDAINRLFPLDGEKAKAILVGHSHFDHLMDVPYIALHRAKAADVYGSSTTQRLLAPIARALGKKNTGVYAVDHLAGDERVPGRWQKVNQGMRFMALRFEHAPTFTLKLDVPFQKGIEIPFQLWRGGALDEDAKELPRTVSQWVQGPVFAYVIDFLDESGAPAYRIYYEDAGDADRKRGVPAELVAEKSVDLAVLCLNGDVEAMEGRPEVDILADLKPKAVMVAHWENFLLTQDLARATGRFHAIPSASLFRPVDLKKILKRLQSRPGKIPYHVPCPTRSTFEFEIETPAPAASPDGS